VRALAELKQKQLDAAQRFAPELTASWSTCHCRWGSTFCRGAMLAKVVQPNHLIAELKIAETQARDIQIGQPSQSIRTTAQSRERLMRVDPAVQNGTVTVDVHLTGELPKGARPDLSVDGTIDLERLEKRALRRPPRVRPGEQHDQPVQTGSRR